MWCWKQWLNCALSLLFYVLTRKSGPTVDCGYHYCSNAPSPSPEPVGNHMSPLGKSRQKTKAVILYTFSPVRCRLKLESCSVRWIPSVKPRRLKIAWLRGVNLKHLLFLYPIRCRISCTFFHTPLKPCPAFSPSMGLCKVG